MRDHQGQGGIGANNTPDQAHLRAAQLPSFRACLELSAMSEEGFVGALTQTSLSRLDAWCLSDLERLLAAALRYGLSPTGRELFLVPDPSGAAPLLVVGVDGWSRILNAHEQFAGIEFTESPQLEDGLPAWVECTIHRWDRRVPTMVREHLCEVRGSSSAWVTHPRRMLRHKAMVQCARITFGVGDIVDPDEAQRVLLAKLCDKEAQGELVTPRPAPGTRRGPSSVRDLRQALGA